VPAQLKRFAAIPAVLLGALALRLLAGVGFANYDTLYALVWGQQLARGSTPQYGIPLAPTPHPLVEALGLALAPLGPRTAQDVTVALGFLALAGCGWVVYRLGSHWFGRAAGALAAAILLTRVPVLSDGVRAYVDIPYLLLVLAALLVESRRRRAGAPVLALLALAGLLRPEAWAFAGLYWVYLVAFNGARGETGAPEPAGAPGSTGAGPPASAARPTAPARSPRELAGLAVLAASAPLAWVLSDALVTGHPLWSLTNTRHTAHELDRTTGLADVPEYIPRRLGEILRPPVLLAAALGGVLSVRLLWPRARLLAAAGALAVVVFAAFATAGLPINTRYAFLAAAILCVFAGAGVFGWTRLARDDRRRRPWMLAGAVLALALLAYAPAQYRSAHSELRSLARQQRIQDDLLALVDDGALALRCGPVGVPNHRPIPLLALRLRTSPANVLSAQVRRLTHGTYVDPANATVARDYTLDRHDPHPLVASVPPGFAPTRANRSWQLYERCVARAG
jgi:hypothetical protein